MPRPRKQTTAPNAVIASAARITAGRRKHRPQQTSGGWQDEAWAMLDTVGELEFYREWVANALSKVTLQVVEVDAEGGETPVTAGPPAEAMAALFDGEAGQAQMLASMGGHLAIPGETWLVGLVEPPEDPTIDQWRVLSHAEIREQGSRWQIDRGDGFPETYDQEECYATRIWRPHPRMGVEAHSSVRSALPILRELVGLSQHVAASIDSRLAGAGVLFVPTELSFTSPTPAGEEDDPATDPFLAALIDAMIAAKQNREDASALAPIVARVPAQYLDKIKHVSFATPFSAEAKDLRGEAIDRLAASLDVPAEVLRGLADVNHWTGWLLDENAIKMHVEPLVEVVTHGLTTRYLWPCLQGQADRLDPALRRFKVIGDTSALRQRPNRSAEAQALHGSLTITDAALARETGFDKTDLLSHPDNAEEFRRRLLLKSAQGVQTADVTVAALDALGVALTPQPSEVGQTDTPAAEGPAPVGAPPAPPAIEAPRGTPPPEDAPQNQAAALLAVSEVMVLRAVERGWNRSGKRGRTRQPVPAEGLDAALIDAWDQVPRAAALCGVDADRLRATLDGYARDLLLTGQGHVPTVLAASLTEHVLRGG